jgi:hypothetical protein
MTDTDQKEDEVLKRMLKTPPQPHDGAKKEMEKDDRKPRGD